jgi:uncharacterized protein (UPF0276 family)
MKKKLCDKPVPASAGIGLRSLHYQQVIDTKPDIAWLEVHSENFFADGGMAMFVLEKVQENYPLSLHGVGLSLGSAKLDTTHLAKVKRLVDRCNPCLVSEHISWSEVGGVFLNDLLPMPYTKESLQTIISNIGQMQDYLQRQILVENPSTYLEFIHADMSEYEFINEVIKQSGCGLLLDINNIYVSGCNNNFDPVSYINNYINNININSVQEIHLAGYGEKKIADKTILIDTHGDRVSPMVWDLYKLAIERFGKIPTLIEWDTNVPELEVLMAEAAKAQAIMDSEACKENEIPSPYLGRGLG